MVPAVPDIFSRSPREADLADQLPSLGWRLLQFPENWEILALDPWVWRVVNQGYKLEFTSPPLKRGHIRSTPVPRSPEQCITLEKEITDVLEKKVVYIVKDFPTGFYRSSFFLTLTKPDPWRHNKSQASEQSLNSTKEIQDGDPVIVLSTLQQGYWATSIDLKDAYLHIPIHPSHHRFLDFH